MVESGGQTVNQVLELKVSGFEPSQRDQAAGQSSSRDRE